jgi:hypothetical protein
MYGIVNGKLAKRKNKTGWSHNFLLVKNKRDGYGRAVAEIVWNFGTIKDTEFSAQAEKFWTEVELVLTELVRTGKIYANSADKVREQFAACIPRPIASPAVPLPIVKPVLIAKPKANPTVAERVNNRFKDLL